MKFHENLERSLAKSITFRIIVITSDISIIYLLTRRFDITLGVVIFSNFSSTILYFTHERIWNAVEWGKRKKTKK